MKNKINNVFLIVFLFLLVFCVKNFHLLLWQNITITGIGTFKVPKDWFVSQRENVVYFTDKPIDEKGYRIYLAGVIRKDKWYPDFSGYDFFENVEHIGNDNYGTVYSNSARDFREEYSINGNVEKRYIIQFNSSWQDESLRIDILVYDNSIGKSTVRKIANSYSRHRLPHVIN